MTGREPPHGAGELRIDPEPTDEEREAVARALASEADLPPAYRSRWKRSGLPTFEAPTEDHPVF